MKYAWSLPLPAVVLLAVLTLSAAELEDMGASLPSPADGAIDFVRDIKPILEGSCLQCHAGGQRMGEFVMDTRESVMLGGKSGPAVVPGKSGESLLIHLVGGLVPAKVMPMVGRRLTEEEIALLRAWIDQDLPWEQGFGFGTGAVTSSLEPRHPDVPPSPPGTGLTNPIDRLLAGYFEERGITSAAPVDDRTFARRVYLDVTGLLPPPDALTAFANNQRPDKRKRLVRELLGDKKRYAEHWLSFWNDLLRNEYRGTGFIDGGRMQITHWLYDSLAENKPYDWLVAELIDPVTGSEGFAKGIIWRGVVNASQRPEMQAAQNISQVFLGINLKCASCHDSFINDWKLADAYGLASVFSDEPLEIVRCDSPTGTTSPVKFLFPQLGTVDGELPSAERRKQLASVLTCEENGRFTRTIVNRLWARFMGRGLVEPIDDMAQEPWNRDVLDWLAVDHSENGYDIKVTIERILTSRAYQMPAVNTDSSQTQYTFTGPLVRRMSAEQFVDATSTLTGAWQPVPGDFFESKGRSQGGQAPPDYQEGDDLRSALVHADPLMQALGRPNREQVVTRRDSLATTLQALELSNGQTLDGMLKQGARYWMESADGTQQEIVTGVYHTALGRDPLPLEREIAVGLLGSPVREQGVEDLLWTIAMLPEFQLIY